jgi:hypothetical protein
MPDAGCRMPGLQFLMRFSTFTLAAALVALSIAVPIAQEKVDRDINWKIRREASDNSQIMRTLHFLTDVYGPRLTGSPNLKGFTSSRRSRTRWSSKRSHGRPGQTAR